MVNTGNPEGGLVVLDVLVFEASAQAESSKSRAAAGKPCRRNHWPFQISGSVTGSTPARDPVDCKLPLAVELTGMALPFQLTVLAEAGAQTSNCDGDVVSPVSASAVPEIDASRTSAGPRTRTAPAAVGIPAPVGGVVAPEG